MPFWRRKKDEDEGSAGVAPGRPDVGAPSVPARRPAVVIVGPPEARADVATAVARVPGVEVVQTWPRTEDLSVVLAQLGRRPGVVVLVDARMPEPRDTTWAIRQLRERFPSHRVVAFGEGMTEEDVEGLLFLGADGFLGAPYEAEAVVAELARHLDIRPVRAADLPGAPPAEPLDEPTRAAKMASIWDAPPPPSPRSVEPEEPSPTTDPEPEEAAAPPPSEPEPIVPTEPEPLPSPEPEPMPPPEPLPAREPEPEAVAITPPEPEPEPEVITEPRPEVMSAPEPEAVSPAEPEVTASAPREPEVTSARPPEPAPPPRRERHGHGRHSEDPVATSNLERLVPRPLPSEETDPPSRADPPEG